MPALHWKHALLRQLSWSETKRFAAAIRDGGDDGDNNKQGKKKQHDKQKDDDGSQQNQNQPDSSTPGDVNSSPEPNPTDSQQPTATNVSSANNSSPSDSVLPTQSSDINDSSPLNVVTETLIPSISIIPSPSPNPNASDSNLGATSNPDSPSSIAKKMTPGVIAAAVLGIFAFILLISLGVVIWRNRRLKSRVAPSAEFLHDPNGLASAPFQRIRSTTPTVIPSGPPSFRGGTDSYYSRY